MTRMRLQMSFKKESGQNKGLLLVSLFAKKLVATRNILYDLSPKLENINGGYIHTCLQACASALHNNSAKQVWALIHMKHRVRDN